MDNVMFLEGKSVYLRGLLPEDGEGDYWKWFNDREVCRFNSHHVFPYSPGKARDYIEYAQKTRDALILAMVRKSDNLHIGNISLQDIHPTSRSADFAIVIGNKQGWGKGYSRESGVLLINHGFNALNLHRITCGTTEENVPMQKLAVSLGFLLEGTRRQAAYKNGRYVDVLEYGLLRAEWESRRGSNE